MTNINSSHQTNKGRFFAYVRVSTPRQGEGVSLLTQREEIAKFAANRNLLILGWFEEKETAAKRGRPVFNQVLERIRNGEAEGLIVYKVDRSARNLKDWTDLGELIDSGVPVYFAGEGIDMHSRSGRLAADIQAVVAADYIRNLREEAKRGIQKRLEQGFYPNYAPVGYLDRGAGKPKELDPERAPLVRLAFSWYATGHYPLRRLSDFLFSLGLRNRAGGQVTMNGLSHLLRNPFYIGFMQMKSREKLYPGLHKPIVTKELFFQVQEKLKSRFWPRHLKHRFKYSRMFRCATCGRSLVGSERKGHIYYRCATVTCPTTCLREEALDTAVPSTVIANARTVLGTVSGRVVKIVDPIDSEVTTRSMKACHAEN